MEPALIFSDPQKIFIGQQYKTFILTIFFSAKLHTLFIFAYTSIMGVITIFSEYALRG